MMVAMIMVVLAYIYHKRQQCYTPIAKYQIQHSLRNTPNIKVDHLKYQIHWKQTLALSFSKAFFSWFCALFLIKFLLASKGVGLIMLTNIWKYGGENHLQYYIWYIIFITYDIVYNEHDDDKTEDNLHGRDYPNSNDKSKISDDDDIIHPV